MSNINAKFNTKLSLESIEEYQEFLKKYKEKIPKAVENIVTKVSKVGLQDNYKSTEVIPTKNEGNMITGGIRTTDTKDTYREFGTGMVGKESPHIPEILALANWKYYVPSEYKATVNGVKGWFTSKDEFGEGKGFVTGIPAEKKFYNAMKNMEDSFKTIAIEEFKKISRK